MAGRFEKLLQDFRKKVKNKQNISIREMLAALENRGFGALLVLPCLVELLPTGVIPGVPSLCATFIILTSSQIVYGRRHPWVPEVLATKTFSEKKMNIGLDKMIPFIRLIDRYTARRLQFLTSDAAERIAALAIIVLALTMYPLEFVPFASSIPSFVVLMFGISFITRDGMLYLLTWALAGAGSYAIYYLITTQLLQ